MFLYKIILKLLSLRKAFASPAVCSSPVSKDRISGGGGGYYTASDPAHFTNAGLCATDSVHDCVACDRRVSEPHVSKEAVVSFGGCSDSEVNPKNKKSSKMIPRCLCVGLRAYKHVSYYLNRLQHILTRAVGTTGFIRIKPQRTNKEFAQEYGATYIQYGAGAVTERIIYKQSLYYPNRPQHILTRISAPVGMAGLSCINSQSTIRHIAQKCGATCTQYGAGAVYDSYGVFKYYGGTFYDLYKCDQGGSL